MQLHELKRVERLPVERLPISDWGPSIIRCNGTRCDQLPGQKVFSLTLPSIFLAARLMNFSGKRIRQIAELQQLETVYLTYTIRYGNLQVLC